MKNSWFIRVKKVVIIVIVVFNWKQLKLYEQHYYLWIIRGKYVNYCDKEKESAVESLIFQASYRNYIYTIFPLICILAHGDDNRHEWWRWHFIRIDIVG